MNEYRGKPSSWLLYNSMGYPDFLFTVLAFSSLLFVFVVLMWITFAILAYLTSEPARANVLVQIVDNMQIGILALALMIFGLAASYTVRRYKRDENYQNLQKLQLKHIAPAAKEKTSPFQDGLSLVYDEEDI